MPEDPKLIMSFDPSTIEHLGVKMYSKLPNALAELIANSYDADSHNVKIKLYDKEKKKIVVDDDGIGMSFQEINDYFLRIGRNRRKEGQETSPSGQRKATGKKGLGKLAFFGIGNTIKIETIRKNSGEKTTFILDWNELITTKKKEYEPNYKTSKCDIKIKGTRITLSNLQHKTKFDKEALAISISKLFNLFDNSFKTFITRNDDTPLRIDDKLKYENLDSQFEWSYSELIRKFDISYMHKKNIKGKIISTIKPLKPDLRGITLFANGRLVNTPEFFGISESSHGFSYLTGWLEVDFVDDWKEDVISTHRQSLNWDLPTTIALQDYLKKFMSHVERVWRNRRNDERKKELGKKTNINIISWFNNLPEDIRKKMEPIIDSITERSELPEDERTNTVQKLHELIPDYPYYHWRHLHKSIHEVSEEDYRKSDYFNAAKEAAIKYIKNVKKRSEIKESEFKGDFDLMMKVFGKDNGKLLITKNRTITEKDMEEGQKYSSAGIVAGFRNPTSHENKKDLHPNIFNDKDCLDILSVISYLFGKLDVAKKRHD